MKRKSLFLISTLILLGNFCNLPKAHAEIIYNNQSYYTAADLIQIGEEVENFKIAECGENYDFWCGQDAFEQLFMSDTKYQIYDMFQHGNITFSAINLSNHTARIIYRDKDDDMFWGEPTSHDLEELYLYWLEPSIDTFDNSILEKYIDDIRNNIYDSSKVHVLFSGNQASDFEWLTPYQESTIELNDVGYDGNHLLRFYAKSNGESFGIFDYADCFSGPYEDGMECTNIYGKDMMSLVAPKTWQDPIVSEEPEPEPIPEPEPEPISEPEPEPAPEPEPEEPITSELDLEPEEEPVELEQTDLKPEIEPEPSSDDSEITSAIFEEPEHLEELVQPEKSSVAQIEEPVEEKDSVGFGQISQVVEEKVELITVGEEPESTSVATTATMTVKFDEASTATAEPKAETNVESPTTANTSGEGHIVNQGEENENETLFPWWLVVVATLLAFLIVWLFVPARKKK